MIEMEVTVDSSYLCLYCQPTKTALCDLTIFEADPSIQDSYGGFPICMLAFVHNGDNSQGKHT